MTSPQEITAEWIGFADVADDERVSGIRARLEAIAGQPEDSRVAAIRSLLDAELALDDHALNILTQGRYRAWIGMEADTVAAISECIAEARGHMTGPQAMRSIMAGQTAAAALTAGEIATLVELAPSFRDALPNEMREAMEAVARHERDEVAAADAATDQTTKPDVPFWKFWAR